jgi:hypothetical protein
MAKLARNLPAELHRALITDVESKVGHGLVSSLQQAARFEDGI